MSWQSHLSDKHSWSNMFCEPKNDSLRIFRHTLNLMQHIGLEIRPKPKPIQVYCWQLFNLIIAIVGISFGGYCFWSNPLHLPNYCIIGLILFSITCFRVISKKGRHILHRLDELLLIVPNDQKSLLERHSRRWTFVLYTFTVIVAAYGLILQLVFNSTEVAKMLIPSALSDGHLAFTLGIIGFLTFEYFSVHILVNGVFYVNVQKVLKQHAVSMTKLTNSLKSAHGHKRAQLMHLITSLYIKHIKVKKSINSTLGVVPLMAFVELFIFYTTGISYIIIYQTGFTLFFMITCILGFTLFYTWFVYYLVCNANLATNELDTCYSKVIELLGDSTSSELQSVKEERALYRTVTCLGVESASAFGLFSIDSSLALSFPNAMIPFLVMIITGYNSMSNSTSNSETSDGPGNYSLVATSWVIYPFWLNYHS